jgi:hypothetical protein
MTHFSKDGIDYLTNNVLPKNNNTNLHLLLRNFLTIHYRFIRTDMNIPETKISSQL